MARLSANIPISHVMSNVTMTVKITGLGKWRFQVWLAIRLLKLAAFVLNVNIVLETTEED